LADFTPISLLASQPIMLVVNPAQPIKSVSDLIALAKANPGKLNCASGGNGTSQHLACELFKSSTGVNIAHVPYKGNAPAMVDVMGGQVEMLFDQMATAVPHVKAGRVRAIAVTSAQRSAAMPDVPTVAESGVPGFATEAWFGLVGPAGMPANLVVHIQQAFAKALAQTQVKEALTSQGLTLIAGAPEEFGSFMKDELLKWGKVIKESGVRLD
jgi:tripartite-type tricarboxylate transporter receptor subunit TctC